MVTIRLAEHDDLSAILAISNWAAAHTPANFAIEPESINVWSASWQQTHDRYPWLVAEQTSKGANRIDDAGSRHFDVLTLLDESSVIGFAKASPHKGRCAYAWSADVSVYIHPEHHNRGVGKALYARLFDILCEQGFATLIAGITLPNPASQRLHETFGFKRVATYERIGWKFGQWHDVGYWQLMLRDDSPPPQRVRSVAEACSDQHAKVTADASGQKSSRR